MDTDVTLPKLTVRDQLILSAYWFSLNAQSAALFPIVIPLQIVLFLPSGPVGNAQQAVLLGWISAVGAVISLFMSPVIGMMSDQTPGAWGRRRPYIAIGTLLLVLSALLLAVAGSVAIFVLALIINQIGSNAANAAYQALLPDRVPKNQRGTASGYMGLMTIIGNIGSLALAGFLLANVSATAASANLIRRGALLFYILTGLALIVGGLITVFGIHEIPFMPGSSEIQREQENAFVRFRHWFDRNWIAPWRGYNFRLVFFTRFAVIMGLTLFMTFIEYYFAQVAHVTNFVQSTAVVALLALVGAICSAFVLGILSDRVRRAPNFRDRIEYLAAAGVLRFLGILPRWLACGFCEVLALGSYYLWPRLSTVGLFNLRLAFPEWSERERRRVLLRTCRDL